MRNGDAVSQWPFRTGPSEKAKLNRKEMMKRARKEFPPLLADLSFADGRRKSSKGYVRDSRVWPFWRRRDGYWEEIAIEWDRGGEPGFSITFWTEQIERMAAEPGSYSVSGMGLVRASPLNWAQRLVGSTPDRFGTSSMFRAPNVDAVIGDARAKILMLDNYLKAGEPCGWVSQIKAAGYGLALQLHAVGLDWNGIPANLMDRFSA